MTADLATVVAIAIRLARTNANQSDEQLAEQLTRHLQAAEFDDGAIDPVMTMARFNYVEGGSLASKMAYRQTLPPYDATRISEISAAQTPPDDLVTLSNDGWASGGYDGTRYHRVIDGIEHVLTFATAMAGKRPTWGVATSTPGDLVWKRIAGGYATARKALDRIAEADVLAAV